MILCSHITEVAGRATGSEGESAAEGALSAAEGALAAAAGGALAAAAGGAPAAAAEGALAAQMAAAIASQGDAVAAAITALGPVMAAAIDGGKERGSGGIELAEMLPAAKFPGQSSDSINPREREVFRWLMEAETAIAALQCGTKDAWRVVCAKVKGSMSNAEFIVFVASAPKDFSDIGQISTYVVEHMCPLAYTAAEEAQRTVTIPDPSSIKSRAAAAITKHAIGFHQDMIRAGFFGIKDDTQRRRTIRGAFGAFINAFHETGVQQVMQRLM